MESTWRKTRPETWRTDWSRTSRSNQTCADEGIQKLSPASVDTHPKSGSKLAQFLRFVVIAAQMTSVRWWPRRRVNDCQICGISHSYRRLYRQNGRRRRLCAENCTQLTAAASVSQPLAATVQYSHHQLPRRTPIIIRSIVRRQRQQLWWVVRTV